MGHKYKAGQTVIYDGAESKIIQVDGNHLLINWNDEVIQVKANEVNCKRKPVRDRVEALASQVKRYEPFTGDSGPYAGQVDWDEMPDGEWVKFDDLQELISKLKQLL